MRRFVLGFIYCVAALVAGSNGCLAAAVDLVPHRAVYTLTLRGGGSAARVGWLRGSMLFEWREECGGWNLEQRIRMRMGAAEPRGVDLAEAYTAWESKDGRRFRFHLRRMVDGEIDEEIRGVARLDGVGQAGTVRFSQPRARRLRLAEGVIFPGTHSKVLLRHAAAGGQRLSRRVFDGTTVVGPYEVNAIIGAELAAGHAEAPPSPLVAGTGLLAGTGRRIRLAFFAHGQREPAPEFELDIEIHENGVMHGMILDFQDLKVDARIEQLERLPRVDC